MCGRRAAGALRTFADVAGKLGRHPATAAGQAGKSLVATAEYPGLDASRPSGW
ncbi:hypothetical protein OH738_12290 [Streptomyces hirsutus]|uniref:hypothetical protein n=1 Tax=Streptomyces hirsutus TaxID=35620 RepID=UPI00386F9913|nr:hypothetical protein OH738_12290 [Streptomyces hirsutus]